ncbi:hypothetical protein LXL04_011230 [Taraxacum kok-saghyz]
MKNNPTLSSLRVHGVHVHEPETTWKPLNPSSCGVASMLSPSSPNPSISIFLHHLSSSSGPRTRVPFLLLPFSLFPCEPVLSLEPELVDPDSGHHWEEELVAEEATMVEQTHAKEEGGNQYQYNNNNNQSSSHECEGFNLINNILRSRVAEASTLCIPYAPSLLLYP